VRWRAAPPLPWFAEGGAGIGSPAEAVTLDVDTVTRLGDDVKIVARPVWAEHTAGEK